MAWRELGQPALSLSGLQLWVHERPLHGSTGAEEDDWLDVTVQVEAESARVRTSGSLLTVRALRAWRDGCARMLEGQVDSASLHTVEPELEIEMHETDAAGHLEMRIEITPDPHHQEHVFLLSLDLSYLPGLIGELDGILGETSAP